MHLKNRNNTLKRSNRISPLFTFDIFLLLCFLIPPMILYLNSILRGFVFTWFMFFLWLATIIIRRSQLKKFESTLIKRKAAFISLFIFIAVVAFNYVFVDTNRKSFLYLTTFINFFFVLIIDSYYSTQPFKYKLSILFYVILALGIQALVSIPYLLSADSYVTRMFASGQLDPESSMEAIKNGVGNNGLYSSVGAIAILGIAVLREFKVKYKLVMIISIVALIISIIISTFFASISLLLVGVAILLIRFHKKVLNLKVLLYISLAISFLIFFNHKYLESTNLLVPVEKKIESFQSEKSDVTGRTGLAQVSLNTFLDNPFFGVGVPDWQSYHIIGEHMPWIDYLANFGFFGVLPLFIFLFILIRNSFSFYFVKDEKMFYRTACLSGTIVFLLSNFISPILTVSNSYMIFLLFYVSYSNKTSRVMNRSVSKSNLHQLQH